MRIGNEQIGKRNGNWFQKNDNIFGKIAGGGKPLFPHPKDICYFYFLSLLLYFIIIRCNWKKWIYGKIEKKEKKNQKSNQII